VTFYDSRYYWPFVALVLLVGIGAALAVIL
jgi:hypothetical protein